MGAERPPAVTDSQVVAPVGTVDRGGWLGERRFEVVDGQIEIGRPGLPFEPFHVEQAEITVIGSVELARDHVVDQFVQVVVRERRDVE